MLLVEDTDSDDDDDDDFIEVATKEGFEPTLPEHWCEEYNLAMTSTTTPAAMSWQQKDRQLDVEDPTSLVASLLKRRQLEQEKEAVARLADCLVHFITCIAETLLPWS